MANRPKADVIGAASKKAGINLSAEELSRLEKGESVQLTSEKLQTTKAAGAGCSGIKLVDLGGGCGIYYTFPASISVCCEG